MTTFFDINLRLALTNEHVAQQIRDQIQMGSIGVVKQFLQPELVTEIRNYLTTIGQHSLPTYEPIEIGKPNFHRLNLDDERAHVRGCFHQFVFYPWNQDVFGLFSIFRDLFQLKNLITGNPAEKYLGRDGEDEMISRIAFQFYPAGKGFLNKHQDPFGEHQLTVPTISFSKQSVDFHHGGAFIEDAQGARTNLDQFLDLGDVVFFDARSVHGVDLVDPDSTRSWLDFVGRWTCLVATNKLSTNVKIPDARDLGTK